ncbi:MAG: FkbM family methyltransferase [Deltaproteobacteria bacterium]|nr:FkbM family methyltransferase [Deltaproteobacteria bacterium]
MARAVGSSGRVWAFEPASSTASFLEQSLAANGFEHVAVERLAVSSASGTARLSLHPNSELNELVREDARADATETVPVTTLDACLERCGWQDIAVLKIDAEGEEANILQGGRRFFESQSPLVLYEVKAGRALHLELVAAFEALGYRSYRLVPGPGVLVPFSAGDAADPYLLNLFCCKPDRARELAGEGLLVESAPSPDAPVPVAQHGWRATLASQPFAGAFAATWRDVDTRPHGAALTVALAWHAMSRDVTLGAPERVRALAAALRQLRTLCVGPVPGVRLVSLARVARTSVLVTSRSRASRLSPTLSRNRVAPTQASPSCRPRLGTSDSRPTAARPTG